MNLFTSTQCNNSLLCFSAKSRRCNFSRRPISKARHNIITLSSENSGGGQDDKPRIENDEIVPSIEAAKLTTSSVDSLQPSGRRSKRQAESTDWVATQLTRRFGIFGGLAWVGVLAFGVISEQLKTRQEVASEEAGTRDVADSPEVVTPEGLRYKDIRIGGGSTPVKGYLTVLDYKATADGVVFEDTKARGKPIVFRYQSRPFTGGMCPGVEMALATMKTGGVRKVIVPPELGFGASGVTLRPTEHVPEKRGEVPPNSTLEYELSLLRISIPPV